MKTTLVSLEGSKKGEVELPAVFSGEVRPDLIKRAVVASWKNRVQAYGSRPGAGNRSSATWDGTRRGYGHGYGWSQSRVPRLMLAGGRRVGRAMNVPSVVGGRQAFPPKVERKWGHKINKKERRLALLSAIAACADESIVKERGHKFAIKLPLVVEAKLDDVKTTKDLLAVLEKLGLSEDLSRVEKKIRAGRGKMRGRKYKVGKSLLIVSAEDKGLGKAASNIPGVDFLTVDKLNVEALAPGSHPGRLVLWTESAIAKLKEGRK